MRTRPSIGQVTLANHYDPGFTPEENLAQLEKVSESVRTEVARKRREKPTMTAKEILDALFKAWGKPELIIGGQHEPPFKSRAQSRRYFSFARIRRLEGNRPTSRHEDFTRYENDVQKSLVYLYLWETATPREEVDWPGMDWFRGQPDREVGSGSPPRPTGFGRRTRRRGSFPSHTAFRRCRSRSRAQST